MVTRTPTKRPGQRKVLLVSDDERRQRQFEAALEVNGFRLERVHGLEQAGNLTALLGPEVVLVDLHNGGDPALTEQCQNFVRKICDASDAPPVIVLSASEQAQDTAALLRAGATDFLVEPFSPADMLRRIEVALFPAPPTADAAPRSSLHADPRALANAVEVAGANRQSSRGATLDPADLLTGRGAAIQRVIEQVRLVAPKNTTVLITGETGTGKERIARAIHALSERSDREMVAVNCGGIPAGLLEDEFFGHVKGAFTDAYQARIGRFEQAHQSTIFLDEVGDLPLELQPKLLRALQEREIHPVGGVETIRFDARVVAATNVDLWRRVKEQNFREDLFYRVNVFPIHLPPLRERREDIPLFINYFMERFCRREGLEPKQVDAAAEADLVGRSWPGNIRELENAVEIAGIRSEDRLLVEQADFPEPRPACSSLIKTPNLDDEANLKEIVRQVERDLIRQVLGRTKGNKTRAAEILQIKRTTLVEKLKKLDRARAAQPEPLAAAEC